MTRLTADDVDGLLCDLAVFEAGLHEVAGLDLRGLALRTASQESASIRLHGARMAAVPISSGLGFIPGFSECVAAILGHLGCDAWVTSQPDVRGFQEAVEGGAEVVFAADDHRFLALSLAHRRCVDNDLATADGYVTALDAAAGGLRGRRVLLLGLGPVGRAAACALVSQGATVDVVEPDEERVGAALAAGLTLDPTDLRTGLARCDLVYDATPAADLIADTDLRPGMIAAVPGLPSAFTPAAQDALGPRHVHEPLAIGVAVMAARGVV